MRKVPTRIVGIDFGMARIGVAVSDERHIIATPFGTIQGSKRVEITVRNVVEALKKMESELGFNAEEVVVGLPLMMDGSIGLLADEVKNFVDKLQTQIAAPIKLWDERLTTVQAERALREGGLSRKKRTRHVDYVAAVVILQSYLDHLSFVKNTLP